MTDIAGFFGALFSSGGLRYSINDSISTPVYWAQVFCHGDELSISECHHTTTEGFYCPHYYDATVFCAGTVLVKLLHYTVRAGVYLMSCNAFTLDATLWTSYIFSTL